jgi:AraC family transcriptional regulator of arabinose operon
MPALRPHIEPFWGPGVGRIGTGEIKHGSRYAVLRPKGRGDWLMIATVAGSGRVGTGNTSIATHPGTIVLYEPDTPQDYRTHPATSQWHILWAHFRARTSWRDWLEWESVAPGLSVARMAPGEARDECWNAVRRAHKLSQRPGTFRDEQAMNALESALLWIRESMTSHGRIDARIRRAINAMASDLAMDFSIPTIARTCGLSASRFAHLFREQTGTTPQRFAERCKLNRAAELLSLGGMSVAEVATAVGYDNPFYFSNRFKKEFGKSPRHFGGSAEQRLTHHSR